MAVPEERYTFTVEWYDTQASIARQYHLFYFTADNTIEMFDLKNKRTFLRRCKYPSVALKDLFVGAQISIYARQLKVLGYGDDFTKSKLEQAKGRTLALVKPNGYEQMGRIVDSLIKNDFVISRMKMCRVGLSDAATFYGESPSSERARVLSSGPVLAVELVGRAVQQQAKDWAGAMQDAKKTGLLNDVYVTQASKSAEAESSFFFDNPSIKTSAQLNNCTVCVIRPHAVMSGQTGQIIDAILKQGFEISAVEQFNLDRQAADEFLEVYKTVVPEYNVMAEQLCSGPCVAIEVRGENAVENLRAFAGPSDPDIARHLRPNTLRALFGVNKVKNAVHCTDLPEDGLLESEYFFGILQRVR